MSRPASKDWIDWHRAYETDAGLRRRLKLVQSHIADALTSSDATRVRIISMCAGDGRDLLGVLRRHPQAHAVRARLVELDATLAGRARRAVDEARLSGVEVVEGDAGTTTAYSGAVPAELLLVCGVFGNISEAAIEQTVQALPMLCAPAATVIWTRHRRPPDVTVGIRRWFDSAGFEELAYEPVPDSWATVGLHRLTASPAPFQSGVRLFKFADTNP